MQELTETINFAATIIIILQFIQIFQMGAVARYLKDNKK